MCQRGLNRLLLAIVTVTAMAGMGVSHSLASTRVSRKPVPKSYNYDFSGDGDGTKIEYTNPSVPCGWKLYFKYDVSWTTVWPNIPLPGPDDTTGIKRTDDVEATASVKETGKVDSCYGIEGHPDDCEATFDGVGPGLMFVNGPLFKSSKGKYTFGVFAMEKLGLVTLTGKSSLGCSSFLFSNFRWLFRLSKPGDRALVLIPPQTGPPKSEQDCGVPNDYTCTQAWIWHGTVKMDLVK